MVVFLFNPCRFGMHRALLWLIALKGFISKHIKDIFFGNVFLTNVLLHLYFIQLYNLKAEKMKKPVVFVVVFLLAGTFIYGQANRIAGHWLTGEGQSQIEIFERGGSFYGKIVWLDEPLEDDGTPKLDKENPDRALRRRPLMGLELLQGFSYDASKNEWSGGTIYDPENGRTYTAYIRLEDNNTLRLRGYVMGMRFMGRTTHWTREVRLRE